MYLCTIYYYVFVISGRCFCESEALWHLRVYLPSWPCCLPPSEQHEPRPLFYIYVFLAYVYWWPALVPGHHVWMREWVPEGVPGWVPGEGPGCLQVVVGRARVHKVLCLTSLAYGQSIQTLADTPQPALRIWVGHPQAHWSLVLPVVFSVV